MDCSGPTSPDPTQPPGGDCHDQNEYCEYWASTGECSNNPDYMLQYCQKSCNVCGGQSPDNCVDLDQNCQYWASVGECSNNPEWMLPNCPKSCDSCGGGVACRDYHDLCQRWAAAGECYNNPGYMLVYCQLSCGVADCYDPTE